MRLKYILASCVFLILMACGRGQEPGDVPRIAAAVGKLSANVAAPGERDQLRTILGRSLREQIAAANRASTGAWNGIQTREQWEQFRQEKLTLLRASLGELPQRPARPRTLVNGRIRGDGFQIHNLVFESRPGLVVTANLYVPEPPRESMPGILLSHSHHNPKEQGELQDMGMTWARAGCYVLVPDHLGHGERRQHPFITAADYAGMYQVSRQDYYFRYDTSLQLYVAGESLMGWMVHDLMTGIDVLLAQPAIDAKRIMLLGSVAGGGDPAGVTAALDERITCVVPFNFGGPQPETRYPLPDDAETSFNYSGGGSWESTRNLRRSAADGFLPWVIVGSVAPRYLIHAHEFAWDRDRDPVWKRYQKIWSFYGASDRLSFAHGRGTLTGQNPPGSHCNNIGAIHRRQIHEAFARWFKIRVTPQDEYTARRPPEELKCLTDEARRQFQPQPLYKILSQLVDKRLAATREKRANLASAERCELMRENWSHLLGNVEPPQEVKIREGSPLTETIDGITVRRELLDTEAGIVVPLLTLSLTGKPKGPVAIRVAADGIAGMLERSHRDIAERLRSGNVVALVEVRGTGAAGPGNDRGQQSASTSHSATHLMLGQTMLGGQLRDLRAVLRHLQRRDDVLPQEIMVFGDAGGQPLASNAPFAYPRRIEGRPPECQPTGALLALLLALFEDDVKIVRAEGGLISYRSLVDSPFVQVPHDCSVPGVLRDGELSDLVAALAPREVHLSRLVDGPGRLMKGAAAYSAYDVARRAYDAAGASDRLRISD
jgi:dienelactone hydrolase